MKLITVFGYLSVGLLWGCTNPFIKRAQQQSHLERLAFEPGEVSTIETLRRLLIPSVFIPFAINQSGSFVYLLMLSNEPLTVASITCNSLTFLITAITSYYLGEEIHSPLLLFFGVLLVVIGCYICISA